MEFGGPFPFTGPLATPQNIVRTAQRVEALGFDYVWLGDHLLFPRERKTPYSWTEDGDLPIRQEGNFFEFFTTVAFIAAQTSKLRLHSNIYCLPLRTPFVTARQAANVDYLSNGRLTLVVGLGWMKDEYDIIGVPWERRGTICDETIEAMRALWAEEAYEGEFFSFGPSWFGPKPVQQPFPIWIGSTDAKGPIARAARLAQGWSPAGLPPQVIAERMKWIRDEMARLGRDPAGFSVGGSVGLLQQGGGTFRAKTKANELLDQIGALAEAGMTHCSFQTNDLNASGSLDEVLDLAQWFAEEIMPSARSI